MIAAIEAAPAGSTTEIAAQTELRVYSTETPLGQAIMGLKEGASTSFTAPNGKDVAVKVLKAETFAA